MSHQHRQTTKTKARSVMHCVMLCLALLAGPAVHAAPYIAGDKQATGSKLHPRLLALTTRAIQAPLEQIRKADNGAAPVLMDPQQRIQVYIKTQPLDSQALAQLTALGVEVEIHNTELNIVQAWVPVAQLSRVAQQAFVNRIDPPSYGQPRAGSVNTEGDAILNSNQLRALGVDGTGIRVGVISDGGTEIATAQASGDLPAGVVLFGTCTPRGEDLPNCDPGRTCNEGTALGEIIHDIAPGAELAITSTSTSLDFIDNVNWLVNEFQADVIVDDIGFFFEPFFADGPVAQAVQQAAQQVIFVSSAGNSGRGHYEDIYRSIVVDGDDLHDFTVSATNTDPSMDIAVDPGQYMIALMQWSDPHGASSNDYDLYLVNQQETDLLCPSCISNLPQEGAEDPVEGLCYHNNTSVRTLGKIGVNRYSGDVRRIELFMLGGQVLEHSTPVGSIFGHSAVPEVLSVGAINVQDPNQDNIASYSSQGPSRIELPSVQIRNKPDLVAVDGVSVSGAGGFPSTFFGTSASAPHVAGIAALLLSIPDVDNAQAMEALVSSADDLGIAGFDQVYGSGRPDAAAAGTLFDPDGDEILGGADNCPDISNGSQLNTDEDDLGDACDSDDDNDGVADATDAFPLDATESVDTDGDGTGNNADPDDDNDQLPDAYEIANGLDPLFAGDAAQDADRDGQTNLQEYLAGRNPNLNEAVLIKLIQGGEDT